MITASYVVVVVRLVVCIVGMVRYSLEVCKMINAVSNVYAYIVTSFAVISKWCGRQRRQWQLHWQHQRQSCEGFTLVELMVVVAVIAILAAVAMPQFMSAGDKARMAKIKSDQQTIANAAQLYMVDSSTTTVPTVDELYKAGYLSENVKTPKGGSYTISSVANDGGSGSHIVVTAADEETNNN